jgi:hypothetical protein
MWWIRHLLVHMEYYESEARIKEAQESENKGSQMANIACGSSGPPSPHSPALMIEGREIGRKMKHAAEVDGEDEYLPPKKRVRVTQLRSPSPLADAAEATSIAGDSGSGREKSPAPSGQVDDAAGQEGMVTPTSHENEETEEGSSENEAGPSVPRVATTPAPQAQRRSQRSKPSATAVSSSRSPGLPALNQVSKVGTKMSIEAKLEYILGALGRAAKRREITAAMKIGWPDDEIGTSSLVSALVLSEFTAHLILAYRILFRTISRTVRSLSRILRGE